MSYCYSYPILLDLDKRTWLLERFFSTKVCLSQFGFCALLIQSCFMYEENALNL